MGQHRPSFTAKVTFPDNTTQQWLDYDPFGQPGRFIDERNNTTNLSYWQWGPMKKLHIVTTHRDRDGGGTEDQPTTFTNDGMGRLLQTSFPDGSHEDSSYEFGQLSIWRTRKGQIKQIHYDPRGREDYHTWVNNTAPRIDRTWDLASRMTSIWNVFSTIDYDYDFAGQANYEGNNIAGSGGRVQTRFQRYANGDLKNLGYPAGPWVRHDYNARGQLKTVGVADGNGNWAFQLINYYYLADGKVEYQLYGNGARTGFDYDERGMTRIVAHHRAAPYQNYTWRYYWRDARDRIVAWQNSGDNSVNPLQDGRGSRFSYDPEGQLTDAWYGAYNPANAPDGAVREDHFNYDALGNRRAWNDLASRGWWYLGRRDNGLNQYSSWSPSAIYYDDNYPGWGPGGNGVLMAEGWITASYNALNQPVAIWSPNMPGGAFTWFGYDPLGRCVKRWVSSSGDAGTNPATYLYYDGWSLIQEGSGAWSPTRLYVQGNRVDELEVTFNVVTSQYGFHHYDASGHCILTTDIGGNIMEQYYYDAFGKPYFYGRWGEWIGGYSQFGNRFLFTGREWLSDLGVYDYRNRLYHPELGRFLQPDPKEFAAGDYNLYRYCHNDPVNRSDPTGLLSLTSQGGGDWDWFNGGVALAQIAVQQAAAMRFVPTHLAKDHKTVLPTKQDHSGGDYDYQFSTSSGRRASGVGVIVQEKLEHVSGVEVSEYQKQPAPLQSNGIFRDRVGLGWRPSSKSNGLTSVAKQTFEVTINGRPVTLSTELGHDVRVINGEVIPRVWIITP